MGRASYSKVDTWNSCPYKYKLRYVDKLETIPDQRPDNALYMGTAIHEGIESGSIEKAIESYNSNYKELTSANELELFKIKSILPKAIEQLPRGEVYEYKLLNEEFIGYIDCLVKISEGIYDLIDFKYSQNITGYKSSGQIHIYKYYYERLTGNTIRNLYYAFIPKYCEKLDESFSEDDIKQRIIDWSNKHDIVLEKVDYDPVQVRYFFARKTLMEKDQEFKKRKSFRCNWCEFNKFCTSNGTDRSELVENNKPEEIIVSEVSLF